MVDVGGLDPTLFYDPTFWDAQLIVPVYVWIFIILLFIGFVSAVAIVYIWFVMRPVAGYGSVGDASTAKGSPTQTFSIWKNRSFVIECMWYYGNVLAYANPLSQMQMWFHNSEKATGVSGGKPVMIVRDGFDGTADFIAEMAVCEIPRRFNADWGFELVPMLDPEGKQMVDTEGRPLFREQERRDKDGKPYLLSSFHDIRYRMPLLEKLYPDGPEIDIYKPYDLAEIYRFTPQDQDSLKHGGDIVEEAKEWAKDEDTPQPGLLDKYGLVVICALVGLASTGIVWYIFPVTAVH